MKSRFFFLFFFKKKSFALYLEEGKQEVNSKYLGYVGTSIYLLVVFLITLIYSLIFYGYRATRASIKVYESIMVIYRPIYKTKKPKVDPSFCAQFSKHLDMHPKKDVPHVGRSFSAMNISPITEFST